VKMDRESKELAVAGLRMLVLCQQEMMRRERFATESPYPGVVREPRAVYQPMQGELGLLRLVRDVLRGWSVPRT
jgi:hypothetical protein